MKNVFMLRKFLKVTQIIFEEPYQNVLSKGKEQPSKLV